MCRPIVDDSMKESGENEPFKKQIINEFQIDPVKFRKKYEHPERHYSQLKVKFDKESIIKLFWKLNITPDDKTITLFGGYTGQFADILREIGFTIIFTDPLKEHVEEAKSKGYEAYQINVEEIPKQLHARTDLFATFECYMPFTNLNTSLYTIMRLLSVPDGLIFAESKITRIEISKDKQQKLLHLKSSFKPFSDAYHTNRIYRENSELRIYHFFQDNGKLDLIKRDCKILKLLYDNSKKENFINKKILQVLSDNSEYSYEELKDAILRFNRLYYKSLPKSMQTYFSNNDFNLFSKRYRVEI